MLLADKFNEKTQNKYSFLRFQDVIVDTAASSVTVQIVAPYEFCDNLAAGGDDKVIRDTVAEILKEEGVELDPVIKFRKVYYNCDIIRHVIVKFLQKNYGAYCLQIAEDAVQVSGEAGKIKADISLPDYMAQAFALNKIPEAVKAHIDDAYCTDIKVNIIDTGSSENNIDFSPKMEVHIIRSYLHSTSKESALIGDTIKESATYISKSPKSGSDLCLCGVVSNLTTKTSKKGYYYHTFTLDDTTGRVECIKFTRSKKRGVLGALNDGATVKVVGEYTDEESAGPVKFIVNRLSFCDIDFDAVDLSEPEKIKDVQPVPIIKYQDSFDNILAIASEANELIDGKSYISIDFETTSTDPYTCKVIEIGMARMVDGKVTEYFDTFIDPNAHIPEDSTKVHGITDSDVADAPYIDSVIPQMLEFIGDLPLIAHNGKRYDYIIIKRLLADNGYDPLTNELLDTLEMADRYAVPGRHRLVDLCEYFGISLVNAHRAYADCIATAKLYAALTDYARERNIKNR